MSIIIESAEFKVAFINEVEEQLQSFEQAILELEKNHDSVEIIQNLFIVAHTLKASSGAVGFEKMNILTHELENVLDKIYNGQIKVQKSIIELQFQCLDALCLLKEEFKIDENDIKTDITEILNNFEKLLENKTGKYNEKKIVNTEKNIPHE